jgi:pimeloyl-ACP methyl ester carboxylesterase
MDADTVTVKGVSWRYETTGDGSETLLLLTGGFGEGTPIPDDFRTFEAEYRTVAPIYPALSSIHQLLEGIVAVLDELGISQAHVFGASLGGAVGQCLVRRHPARVKSLILANTSGPARWAGYVVRLAKGFLRPMPGAWLMASMRKRLTKLLSEDAGQQMNVREKIDKAMAGFSKEGLLALCDYVADYHLRYRFSAGDLDAWPGKVQIIESEDDPMVPRRYRTRLKALYPQDRLHTFPHGGHTPGLHHPEEFIELLRGFLRSSSASLQA